MTDDLRIPDEVLVQHIANNYSLSAESPFGNIPVEEFVNSEIAQKSNTILSKLLQHIR
jgi:hypothetical protein